VFRNFRSPVAMAMLAGALAMPAAFAQQAAPGLHPHVDLDDALDQDAGLQAAPAVAVEIPPALTNGDELFSNPPPAEGGWKGLARLLEALEPSVDTSIPLTPSQITDRISSMLDQGQNQQALDIIDKRMAQREASNAIGADVQLLFLRGRALAALGRHDEAVAHYLDMTTKYPELPEPWNNLAAEYVRQGRLEMARDALQMALTADPHYAAAKANMGWVQLMLAGQSFEGAAAQGVPGARGAARETRSILAQ